MVWPGSSQLWWFSFIYRTGYKRFPFPNTCKFNGEPQMSQIKEAQIVKTTGQWPRPDYSKIFWDILCLLLIFWTFKNIWTPKFKTQPVVTFFTASIVAGLKEGTSFCYYQTSCASQVWSEIFRFLKGISLLIQWYFCTVNDKVEKADLRKGYQKKN